MAFIYPATFLSAAITAGLWHVGFSIHMAGEAFGAALTHAVGAGPISEAVGQAVEEKVQTRGQGGLLLAIIVMGGVVGELRCV